MTLTGPQLRLLRWYAIADLAAAHMAARFEARVAELEAAAAAVFEAALKKRDA